jgi:hypothetical protein
MTDHKTVARRYIDLWNERTPSQRREMLSGRVACRCDGYEAVTASTAQPRWPARLPPPS